MQNKHPPKKKKEKKDEDVHNKDKEKPISTFDNDNIINYHDFYLSSMSQDLD